MPLRFDIFDLDPDNRELRGPDGPIAIPPKALSVLCFLVERARADSPMVLKSDLMERFWPANTSEASLQTTLSLLRKILRQAGAQSEIVKTVHGQGVRFVASVTASQQAPAADPEPWAEQRHLAVVSVHLVPPPAPGVTIEPALELLAARAAPVIAAQQGQLLHMMLTGFTARFGLGPMQEDAVRRALAAGFELGQALWAETLAPLGLGVGVACGPLPVDGDSPPTETWVPPGPTERRAVALAQSAAPGEVWVDVAALPHLRDAPTRAGPDPTAHRVLAPPGPRAGVPAPAGAGTPQMIGRGAEMAFLHTAAAQLDHGRGQAVLLSGPAGIGKSRLIREFRDSPDLKPLRRIGVNCLPRLRDTPLAPIGDLMSAMSALTDGPDPVADPDPITAALAARLSGAPASQVLAGLSEVLLHQRSAALLCNLVAQLCKAGPVLMIFEDVHWMDGPSAAHLGALIRAAETLPLLLVLSSRPTDSPPLTEAALHLAPLGLNDSIALLQTMPAARELSRKALQDLAQRGAGNPFFLEELALSHHSDDATAPSTVRTVIEQRVSALPADLRQILYAVVTIGPPAPVDLIAHLTGLPEDKMRPALGPLMQHGFLREDPEGLVCRHMLLADAAYAMIAPPERQRLHHAIARYLQAPPKGLAVPPEMLAWHLQEAGDPQQAADCWTRASHAALSRAAADQAITFARNGLALLPDPPDSPAAKALAMGLHLSMAPALMAARGYGAPEAGAAFARAHQLNAELGVAKLQPRILLGLWLHDWVAGDLQDSLNHARALNRIGQDQGLPGLQVQGQAGMGAVLTHLGAFRPARAALLQGLEYLHAGGPDTITAQNAAVTCASYAAWTAALLGDLPALAPHIQLSEQLSRALDNPFARAIHFSLCAEASLLAGDLEGCSAQAQQAVSLSETHHYPFWRGTALVLLGTVATRHGHAAQGLDQIDQGIEIFRGTGAGVQLANWYGLRAEALLANGQPQQALHSTDTALTHATQTGDLWFSDAIHTAASQAHLALGNTQAAADHQARARARRAAHLRAPTTDQFET